MPSPAIATVRPSFCSRRTTAEFFEPVLIPNCNFFFVNSPANAAPGDRFKFLSRTELQSATQGRGDNRSAQWMLTSLLQAPNQPDQFVFSLPCSGNYRFNFRFAFR